MSGFTVDPSGLDSTAPRWGDQAAQVQNLFDTLTGKLNAEGDCWGNDQAGHSFASKYVPAALAALQYMDAVNQGLQSMVDGVATWARNYVNSDEAVKEDLIAKLGP